MLRLRKKHTRVYRFTMHVFMCTFLILLFHFMRQSDFLGKTVVAKENQANNFLEKDILPFSSQASLFNPDGLYYQTLATYRQRAVSRFPIPPRNRNKLLEFTKRYKTRNNG